LFQDVVPCKDIIASMIDK